MPSKWLYRASGVALLLGVVLVGIGTILRSTPFPGNVAVTLMGNIGLLLLLLGLVGLPGIFARQAQAQAQHAGWLGVAGFILMFIGWFLHASYFFVTSLLSLPQAAPKQAGACSVIGGCSLGNVTPAFFIFFPLAGILFALGGIL